MPRTKSVQVPGEVPETPEAEAPAADEQVSVSKSVLENLLAEVAALKAKVNAAPVKKGAVSQALLPDQDSVDPDKIKNAVLTKQGYVVPTGYGSFPGEKKV